MDTFTHAAWGWVALRKARPGIVWWGVLAGSAPDLLFYVPNAIEQVSRTGVVQRHEPTAIPV